MNMIDIPYNIVFYDFWHCSSGQSGGAEFDALVIKDKNGLPYVPGKTIKGHIREAAILLDDSTSDFIKECFGLNVKDQEEHEGRCIFPNACMSKKERDSLASDDGRKLIPHLYKKIASTAIDNKGVAKTNSLREIEVVVPITLEGVIENCPDDYVEYMKNTLRFIKRVGLNRHRGLGRCDFIFVGDGR